MSGPVRTIQKRMMKARGLRREAVPVGMLFGRPIVRRLIVGGDGTIHGYHWPRLLPKGAA